MIPIPQYPIYSATIDLLGGNKVGYYLDERNGWDLNLKELERSLAEATEKGITVNSLVVINPGNPTGQVLSRKTVQVNQQNINIFFNFWVFISNLTSYHTISK